MNKLLLVGRRKDVDAMGHFLSGLGDFGRVMHYVKSKCCLPPSSLMFSDVSKVEYRLIAKKEYERLLCSSIGDAGIVLSNSYIEELVGSVHPGMVVKLGVNLLAELETFDRVIYCGKQSETDLAKWRGLSNFDCVPEPSMFRAQKSRLIVDVAAVKKFTGDSTVVIQEEVFNKQSGGSVVRRLRGGEYVHIELGKDSRKVISAEQFAVAVGDGRYTRKKLIYFELRGAPLRLDIYLEPTMTHGVLEVPAYFSVPKALPVLGPV